MLRLIRRISLGSLLLAVVLSACSSAPATTAPAGPAPTTAAPTASAPTAAPTIVPTVAPTDTPAPTATTAPTATPLPASGSACLVGTWELSDMSTYMESVMAKSGSAVTLVGQTGGFVYTFGADGNAHVEAQDFTMKMSMDVQKLKFDINITISGAADSQYTATADKVTYSNGKVNGLKISATMNGTELFSTTPDELAAMFGVSPDPKYNTFGYQCDGDTLVYTPPIADAQPITLKRVNP
jgi:hypothetical protein